MTTLGDYCDVTMGQAPTGDTYNTEENGLPLLAGASDLGDVTPAPSRWTSAPTQVCEKGDIILCIRATIGDRNWADRRYCLGRGVAGLRAKPNKLEPRYLWHWIAASTPTLMHAARGATFLQVNRRDIENLPCSPPRSLAEQRRIADILDKADAIRRKRKEAIALTEELLRSAFLEMFGDPVSNPKRWPVSTFGAEVTVLEYGPRFYNEKYAENGVRIVRITDLESSGVLDFETMPRLVVDARDQARYLLQPGDVIFARSGATVGKTALSVPGDPPAIPGAYFIRLRFNDRVSSRYARQVLASESIQQIIVSRSRQSAQQNFSGPGIRELPLPVPPRRLQDKLDTIAAGQARHLVQLRRASDESNDLFNTLVARAFSGKLSS